MVEGRSNRKYTDEDTVAETARAAGYTDIYKQSLIPITEMEKLMGKKALRKYSAVWYINRRADRHLCLRAIKDRQ